MVWKERQPVYPNIDEDMEMEIALKQPFTAMALALRRGHHPRLWAKIKGSPFEVDYRQHFELLLKKD